MPERKYAAMAFIQKQGHWKSENGWRMCDAAELDYGPIPGTDFKLGVRKGVPNLILKAAIARLHREVEPMIVSQIGCYTGSNSMSNSNHNSATAFDYNWNLHQYQKWGTWGVNRPKVDKIIADFRGVLEFGGNWTSPRDEMHFELHFGEGHAGTEALAADLRNGLWGIWGEGSAPAPGVGNPDYLEIGDQGAEVGRLQAWLNFTFPNYRATPLEIDDIFGPMTAVAVQEFQARVGIDADGVVGPITRAKLAEHGVDLGKAPPAVAVAPPKPWPQNATDRALLEYVAEQLGPGHEDWPSAGTTLRDRVWSL